jgi:hypothetical protein
MAIKFLDTLDLSSINNATTDTDKFLVSDSGIIKYRTGAQVRSDIGAGTGNGTVTSTNGSNNRLAVFSSASNVNGSNDLRWDGTQLSLSSSALTTLAINDDNGEGPMPKIDFYMSGNKAATIFVAKTNNFEVSTVDSNGADQRRFLIDGYTGQTSLTTYTSTSVATTGSLNPNQNFQAASQDTLANLGVDPDGNIVRGDQEGTWTFTKAQLSTSLGQTLISAPGAGKGIVILESNWMVKYAGSGAMSTSQFYDIRQGNNVNGSAIISRLPGNKINEIMLASQGTIVNPSYGFYSRDVPTDAGGRTYKANVATTLNRVTSGNPPANLISVSIKLKYRIFNGTTF